MNKNLKTLQEILNHFVDELNFKFTENQQSYENEVEKLIQYRMEEAKEFNNLYDFMDKFNNELLKHFWTDLSTLKY